MSPVSILKPVVSHIEEESHVTAVGIFLLNLGFCSFVTIFAVLCHCFKAMIVIGILP